MNDPRLEAEIQRIDCAAAEWLIRRDRGLTATEQDDFFHWLAADPRHGEWLACHQQSWKELNLLAQWRPEHSTKPNPDLLAAPRRAGHWSWLALAAAASVVLTVGLWRPWRPVPPLAGPALVAAVPAMAYESRVLDDGTIVELNRGAAIEVQFTPGERRVRLLQGEAQFTVAKNPLRPFIVDAAIVTVRAIGTAFNVRLGAEAVEVLVTEGKVRLDDQSGSVPSHPIELDSSATTVPAVPVVVAGQRAIIPLAEAARPQVAQVSEEEMTRALGWRPKLLDFTSAPLSEVVAEFNRYNRAQLVVGDPALGAVPIVASFRSDNVDGFVRLLEITAGVRAERVDETIILRRDR